MARVTGFKLRQAIKIQEIKRDSLNSVFTDSLSKFPDEKKDDPQRVSEDLLKVETSLVKLQTALAFFNLSVKVEANGNEMSLCEAIKQTGVLDRLEREWSHVHRRFTRHSETRDKDTVVSIPTVSVKDALDNSLKYAKAAASARAAIAEGNAKEIAIEFLDEALLR